MSIRDMIREKIVTPGVNSGENSGYSVAEVKKADEANNICNIKYRDFKDRLRTKENVPVRIYSNSSIDWFPSQGDKVIIELHAGEPIIIGSPDLFAGIRSKESNTLESDIYSDNMSGSIEGGYIM